MFNKELIEQGKNNLELAERNMIALMELRKRFKKEKPFKGLKIAMALHITKETGVLARTFKEGGAEVALASGTPYFLQEDVFVALESEGIKMFGKKDETPKEYFRFLHETAETNPDVIVDDGGDLSTLIQSKHKDIAKNIIGGSEETTTGVFRLKALERNNELLFPVVAVNNNTTKHLMDNYYGTGQSTFDGIFRATSMLIAGKTVVVAGYGACGKGVALRAKGMGANVIITEVDPFAGLQAVMDGFRVMTMDEASKRGDVFITVTGNYHVITERHFKNMKPGAVLANSGHFDVEIDMEWLKENAEKRKKIRPYLEEYFIDGGKSLYVIAKGRVVNLVAAEGNPSDVMSMSFAGQALAVEYLIKNRDKLDIKVHTLPEELDKQIARLQLKAMGVKIDQLTKEQEEYIKNWEYGAEGL